MEFVKYGFDVYSAEVDDKGIDFVVRNRSDKFFEIQVKSIRNKSYVFMRKEVFAPKENLYLALLVFGKEEQPIFALIPSLIWTLEDRPDFFVDRANYVAPEFGINISGSSIKSIRSSYSFLNAVENLVGSLQVNT